MSRLWGRAFLAVVIIAGLFSVAAAGQAASPASVVEKHPASYWKLPYIPRPKAEHSYTITLRSDNPDKTVKKVNELARSAGLRLRSGEGRALKGKTTGEQLVFVGGPEDADAFSQQVFRFGKLTKFYSAKANVSVRQDISDKAKAIRAEMERNRALLNTMPVAKTLLSELYRRYREYLDGCEDVAGTARVTINLESGK